ncbi:Type II restriction modification system N4-cytosine or N6-adenine DNA methyltransferase [Mycoplasmopsis bovigenitalium 51080]|uniref:Methyltransferase n=1 Tax=Mycoplasmopsis bovigenitalium 51080 TaxID=1188235 RepID=N9TU43_9BACT|nr:site-specific DNA-methyltransferase [Mycoplasmopsis bovigenitalium]ENY69615.1 Type II restriction modification system N4-cytosine or N6-adenine DNA methyltransferase [Mycoplasmopsis bovigenitalium 51080]
MKTNLIINGDCIAELNKIPEESIDLIFADPPYWMRTSGTLLRVEGTEFKGVNDQWDKFASNEDYYQFTRKWLEACYRVLKKNGSFWVIGGMQCIYTIGAIMQDIGFWFLNDVIWHKINPTPNFKGTRLTNSHETLIWATKSEKSKYTFNYKTAKELNINIKDFDKGDRKQLGSVWHFSVASGNERVKDCEGVKLHNTQKPEELLYRIINISSNIGDVVLDPFGGTMTTGKVAKMTGRNYIMIEKDPKYCYYGQKRIDETLIQIGNIEKAVYDKKPPKTTLKEMINAKYFIVNEYLYFKDDEKGEVMLNKDGKVILNNGEITDIHSAAAKISNKNANRLNGFDYWFVIRDNQKVSIKEIRENYRRDVLGFK